MRNDVSGEAVAVAMMRPDGDAAWQPPHELAGPVPRSITRRFVLSGNLMLIGALVWLLVVFLPIMLLTAHQKAVLLHRGMMTTGRVVSIRGPGDRSHGFDVTYVYRVAADSRANKREYVEHRGARKGDLAAIEMRSDVEVIYDPREPEHSDIAGLFEGDRRPCRRAFERIGLLCAVFAAMSGLCLADEYRVIEMERRLLVSGALAKADVADVRLVNGRYTKSLTVHYSFPDSDGRIVSGARKGVSTDPLESDNWRASRLLVVIQEARTVVFDSLDPSRNMFYPGIRWCCRSHE